MSPEDHRRHAAEYLRIAESISDPRTELLAMAQSWLHIADKKLVARSVAEDGDSLDFRRVGKLAATSSD